MEHNYIDGPLDNVAFIALCAAVGLVLLAFCIVWIQQFTRNYKNRR